MTGERLAVLELEHRLAFVERQRDKLRAALRAIEWEGLDGLACPSCSAGPESGHNPGCVLAEALR